ncbi:MAG TPA: ribosome maturation factor RimP [Acidimicrobiales bacterium]|nr:ribosome maturation factor RimP [Acidimicrobiales bacterium]
MDWDATLRPLLEPLGLDLYDVEFSSGTLDVVVSRDGGVDLDALTAANRVISEWLDAHDPIAGRFTLDVSSPGLERRLRTPAHFRGALGEVVTLREVRDDAPTRRLEGTLSEVTDSALSIEDDEVGVVVVPLDKIERARTVFYWGATKPVSNKTTAKGARTHSTSRKG